MTASHKSAVLSPDGSYRYRLERWWGDGPKVTFVMLNPSTADADVDDPTIRRCMGFAKSWGMDGIIVVNQFAFRATKPADAYAFGRARGEDALRGADNHFHMVQAISDASLVVCAWGAGGGLIERPRGDGFSYSNVAMLCDREGVPVACLGKTKAGHPRHPLYMPADTEPQPWP